MSIRGGEITETTKQHLYDVECPWCGKILSVNKEVTIITPAVKAEKEEKMYTERVTQTTLDQQEEVKN